MTAEQFVAVATLAWVMLLVVGIRWLRQLG